MIKSFKLGLAKIYIYEERGNTYIKDKKGESRPLKYGAYVLAEECLHLRDLMNLTGMSLVEVAEMMDECGVVLIGHTFNISFYDIDSVDKFINAVEKQLT